ncbi:MAG: hypothetical protein PHT33_06340 [bacterium]|nr:hypothetical protein [bacterium]
MISYVRTAFLTLVVVLLLSATAFALDASVTDDWKSKAYKITDAGLEMGILPITEALLPPDGSSAQPSSVAGETMQLRAGLSEYLVFYIYTWNRTGNVKAYMYPAFNAICIDEAGKQRMTALWDSSSAKRGYLQSLAESFTRNPASDDDAVLLALFDGLSDGYSYRLKEKYPLLPELFENINGVLFPGAVRDGVIIFPKPGRTSKVLRLYLPNIRLQESGIPKYKLYDFVFAIPNPEYGKVDPKEEKGR